jgi:Mrp family chromosome partitioning ATPase
MTEHSKIPLPGHGETTAEVSLFERASGAFGLDPFRSAPVPHFPHDASLKRPQAPHSVNGTLQPATAAIAPLEQPVTVERAPLAEPTVSVPTAVRFGGTRHEIDRDRLQELGMIVPEAGATELLEEFRIIKRQVIASAQATGDAAARRILICSPLPGDGKTFCATNLAIAMAGEREGEVLLIDADFAKPSILSTLGLPKGAGLMDALADPSIKVEDLVMGTDIPGLFVLPAGNQTTVDSEWLASTRAADVLDRLTMGAPNRMLVFDSPPALAASPAADLARHVGQAIIVARADKTGRGALDDAIQLLAACPDIKLLLNATQFSPSGRRFGTYYGYEG